jgi:rubrerythrin
MDLSRFGMRELLLAALKSELESERVYRALADRVKNYFLKDRLKFLAGEEQKHAAFVSEIFKKRFPADAIEVPESSPVPLPEVRIEGENVPISKVIAMAMDAEKAAHDFYTSMAELYRPKTEIERKFDPENRQVVKKMLLYIAAMEMGHYRLLEVEEQKAHEFEEYDVFWEMTHLGP